MQLFAGACDLLLVPLLLIAHTRKFTPVLESGPCIVAIEGEHPNAQADRRERITRTKGRGHTTEKLLHAEARKYLQGKWRRGRAPIDHPRSTVDRKKKWGKRPASHRY